MELLLSFEKFEEKINEEGLSSDDFEEIAKGLEFGGAEEISEVNIGLGSDVMVILVTILTVANVFSLGDKIEKGIEGWIKLGKRIKKFYKEKELVAVDKDGASLLAIEFISNIEPIDTLEKKSEQEVNLIRIDNIFRDSRKPDDLISKPYNYFIQAYLINDKRHYVIGIKSTGEVNLIKCFESGNSYGITEVRLKPQKQI